MIYTRPLLRLLSCSLLSVWPLASATAAALDPQQPAYMPWSGGDPVRAAAAAELQASPASGPVRLSLLQETAPAPDQTKADLARDGSGQRFSFGERVGAAKWEVAGVAAYMTALHLPGFIKERRSFHFSDEGWFGKSTANLGVDKLAHGFNAYLLTELLQWRIARKTDDGPGSAITAAALSIGLMTYAEVYDAHEVDSGFSLQDLTFNIAGAGFSVLRNTVPGLKEKLDFRMLVMPNHDIISFKGKEHFEQQRFLLALQLSGFEGLERSPLRFVELHAGYRATNFTFPERARGEIPKRKPFIGIGLNLQQLFFREPPRSTAGRLANRTLDYLQVPYTAAHFD